MEKKWRCSMGMIAFIPITSPDDLYLSATDTKAEKSTVIREISTSSYFEVTLEEPVFNLRLVNRKGTLDVDVKSDSLPDPNKWYTVKNIYEPTLALLIENLEPKKGYFDDEFNGIFSSDHVGKVSFITPAMDGYIDCLREMERRLNCELKSKTKKIIPGHRYDAMDETYYIVAKVNSRRALPDESEFNNTCPEVFIYVNYLKDSDKNCSDVLSGRVFGNGVDDLRVMYKAKSLVDCGEALKDDIEDYNIYIPKMIEVAIDQTKTTNTFGYVKYSNLLTVFEPFSYFNGDKDTVPDYSSVADKLKMVTEYSMYDCLLVSWDTKRFIISQSILATNTLEANIQALIKNFLGTGFDEDINIWKIRYFEELFRFIGISLIEIAKNLLYSWNVKDLYVDFDHYLKGFRYLTSHYPDEVLNLRNRSLGSDAPKSKETLEEHYKSSPELVKVIRQLYNKARYGYGMGVSSFKILNVGSKRSPIEYVRCTITLEDILKAINGESKAAETLKYELINNKFTQLTLLVDKGADLK